jgi:hypothetical protein
MVPNRLNPISKALLSGALGEAKFPCVRTIPSVLFECSYSKYILTLSVLYGKLQHAFWCSFPYALFPSGTNFIPRRGPSYSILRRESVLVSGGIALSSLQSGLARNRRRKSFVLCSYKIKELYLPWNLHLRKKGEGDSLVERPTSPYSSFCFRLYNAPPSCEGEFFRAPAPHRAAASPIRRWNYG